MGRHVLRQRPSDRRPKVEPRSRRSQRLIGQRLFQHAWAELMNWALGWEVAAVGCAELESHGAATGIPMHACYCRASLNRLCLERVVQLGMWVLGKCVLGMWV